MRVVRPSWIAAWVSAVVLLAPVAPSVAQDDGHGHLHPPTAETPIQEKLNRFVPKPAGTKEHTRYWFGPYAVPPGWDANRVDLDLPVADGFLVSVEPSMHRVEDASVPSHQEAHIHHAHWFALDPGNQEDNYTGGNTEWIFGNGDEETRADFQERTDADPKGPMYGQFIGASGPQLMIYMLHNKTSAPLNVYIALDVTFVHGTASEIKQATGREAHDITGVLFGRTFDVPRQAEGDGVFETTKDQPKPILWTSTVDGTLIGTGSHLHPGGVRVITENLGSKDDPCPDDGRGYGGTTLLQSDALFRNAKWTEDFQMEVTHPGWRAPIRKGDVLRITGVYENKEHAWYTAMTHQGLYIDEQQKPKGHCTPYLVDGLTPRTVETKRVRHVHVRSVKVRRRAASRRGSRKTVVKKVKVVHWHKEKVVRGIDPVDGVPNRPWHHAPDPFCGLEWGAPACERAEADRPAGPAADTVAIANFLYSPGDLSLSGTQGQPPTVKQGSSLRFVNVDQALGIRHSVTTCPAPCNGRYVANYPFADGRWDSGTLGFDAIDGGSPNPVSETPKDLRVGRYTYFCRIHPWMRGAFEVTK